LRSPPSLHTQKPVSGGQERRERDDVIALVGLQRVVAVADLAGLRMKARAELKVLVEPISDGDRLLADRHDHKAPNLPWSDGVGVMPLTAQGDR